eukprot:CAMPEP_0172635282 /NCGR_PEP_ID=MMETSP1068-20121228/198659_1 /TAXON_ID=35684 /ORGANISM="Pseudopedinella elastica, Strain CCMP716" /LENGTH=98 /DNA_ID=CAMNT_0013447451 /DNA_START=8 /DNA_END=301 /DNA_ORIENTATION=+
MAGLEPGPSSSVYSTEDYSPISPYLVAEFPSEEAAVAVCDRAILIKSMIKIWADGASYKEASSRVRQLPADFVSPHLAEALSWSVTVDAFGLSLSLEH